jgi:DNA-binding LacI/PurR family transcriptional regulator
MSDEKGHSKSTKHARIYNDLMQSLKEGHFLEGDRIPTEHELANQYGVSRPTVTKALNRLKKEGLITRKIGSGSFVSSRRNQTNQHKLLGLVIPSLGKGEIFEPICAQIASLSEEHDFSLIWGGISSGSIPSLELLEKMINRFIKNGISGVFFAPMELTPAFHDINVRIAAMLDEAHIPIVLIDTDYEPFNRRTSHDLVGIDNYHGGYIATEHFLKHGFERVDYVYRPFASYTLLQRKIGFQSALLDYGIEFSKDLVHCGDPGDVDFVQNEILAKGASNIVCGNDETAAALMRTLQKIGVHVPKDVRLIGFDDVYYSHNLRVPLTTVRQPCNELGATAVMMMMNRLLDPLMPPLTVYIQGTLVIRDSCGIRATKE